MENLILINNKLSNRFWVETIETTNYLQNRFLIKNQNHSKIISEEAWTDKQQNLQYVYIFGSFAMSNIPNEKRSKSKLSKSVVRHLDRI